MFGDVVPMECTEHSIPKIAMECTDTDTEDPMDCTEVPMECTDLYDDLTGGTSF